MAVLFDDDLSYRDWLAGHPGGYVLNVRSSLARGYAVLHSASCPRVNNNRYAQGAFTERGYRKVCAGSVSELSNWLIANISAQRGFSAECACVSKAD